MLLPRIVYGASVFLVILVSACWGGGGDSKKEAEPTVAPTATVAGAHPAEQALGLHIQSNLNAAYAGDCSLATAGDSAGKWCSTLRGEREGQRAYVIGRTLSEGDSWAFLTDQGGRWSVSLVKKITPATAAAPGVPWPLRTGVDVVIAGAGLCSKPGDGLNVREGPSLQQKAVDCLSDGTLIKLASGPVEGDGVSWWQVQGRSGWISGDYVRYPDAVR